MCAPAGRQVAIVLIVILMVPGLHCFASVKFNVLTRAPHATGAAGGSVSATATATATAVGLLVITV